MATVTSSSSGVPSGHPGGAWAPLRRPVYRSLWTAQLGSNVGTWMQTVGAQWLLVDRPHSETLVALVQTASTLPVMLLALPAGVLADALDRRRLLIAVQGSMVVVATALAVLTVFDLAPPSVLLGFTFLLGCGVALTGPAWQAIQPELVPRDEIPAAAALGSLAVNLARAVGPALAGFLVAFTGPAAVFAINALSFLGVTVAIILWHRPAQDAEGRAERALAALRAGTRYVRHAPIVRRILLRSALFVLPGSALWALLPIVASQRLGLDATGYGLMLAALGGGAVAGALSLSTIKAHVSDNRLLALGGAVFGLGTLGLTVLERPPLVMATLVVAGMGWLAVLSTLNAALQLTLPGWVRARGLSTYLLVFLGGQAIGSVVWGLTASVTTTETALVVAGGLLVAGAVTTPLLPLLPGTARLDRNVSAHWPTPHLVLDPEPDDGPVLVLSRYRVPEADRAAFLLAMQAVGRSRRRSGAIRWRVYQDGEHPDQLVEAFVVASWGEHLHQHDGRLTGADREIELLARDLADGEPEVEHLLAARAPRSVPPPDEAAAN